MITLGVRGATRFRTVEESRILDQLLLLGFAYELQDDRRISAEVEASRALERWIVMGLPFELVDGKRRFDPAEVLNFLKWSGTKRGDPFWEERFVTTSRRFVHEFHGSENLSAPPKRLRAPRRFAAHFRREFCLREHAPGARIRLRIPLPLEDAAVAGLQVAIDPVDGVAADFRLAPGRLDAGVTTPRERSLTLGARVTFNALPVVEDESPCELASSEREVYLQAREGFVHVTPRVAALATELAGARRDPAAVVTTFWEHMLKHLTCGMMHYGEFTPGDALDWVLENGWFDCQVGSALLVALCRARGIPARVTSGYYLYSASPTNHYCAEVWMGARGWVPLDTGLWDLSRAGRDQEWREYFVGYLDYRMKTQVLPRRFTGTPNVHFPQDWQSLARAVPEGIETRFSSLESGELIYRDIVKIEEEHHRGG